MYPVLAAYGTLDAIRRHVRERDPLVTQDDAQLLQALRDVTRRIDKDCSANAPFMPSVETRYFDAMSTQAGGNLSGQELLLFAPLLEATTITNGDGTVIAPGNYMLWPRGKSPAMSIRLTPASAISWTKPVTGDPVAAIAITGVWGFNAAYSSAWVPSGDTVLSNPLTASGTTITVADADGADVWGRSPRFSPGQLLRIGSEYLALVAVNPTSNTLTVVRAQRGTTAAEHASGAAISIWQPDEAISEACVEWAAYVYQRQGRYEDTTVDVTGVAQRFPKDMPPRVGGLLSPYRQRYRMFAT